MDKQYNVDDILAEIKRKKGGRGEGAVSAPPRGESVFAEPARRPEREPSEAEETADAFEREEKGREPGLSASLRAGQGEERETAAFPKEEPMREKAAFRPAPGRELPPRDDPFDADFKPHFNWLKCVALFGVHILHAFKLEPKKVFFFHKGLADFAQRIYGYVDKAAIAPEEVRRMEEKIRPFVARNG